MFTAEAQRTQRNFYFLLSAETPESKNHDSTGLPIDLADSKFVYKLCLLAKASSFSFAVLSTAKEKVHCPCALCGSNERSEWAVKPILFVSKDQALSLSIATAIRRRASSSVSRGQPKLRRTKPGPSKSAPSCMPRPPASKNSIGFLIPALRTSIQAR